MLGRNVTSSIFVVHALLGCDTTSRVHGIGKGIALKKPKINAQFRQMVGVFQILQVRRLSRPGRRLCYPYLMLLLLKALILCDILSFYNKILR